MRPLRALYLALICHAAQGRLSRSRSRVHHSTIHHATMHHPTAAASLPDRHRRALRRRRSVQIRRGVGVGSNEPDSMGAFRQCSVRLFSTGPRERDGRRAGRAVPGDSSGAGWGAGVASGLSLRKINTRIERRVAAVPRTRTGDCDSITTALTRQSVATGACCKSWVFMHESKHQ